MKVQFLPSTDGGTDHDVVTCEADGDEVGRLSTEPTDLVVTGGARLAASTLVGSLVHPEHHGEGVMTGLVRAAGDDARDRGQVVLTVDRPTCSVFERFGFGVATESHVAEIDVAAAAPVAGTGETTHVESLPVEKFTVELPSVFDRCTDQQVGTVRRTRSAWYRLADELTQRRGAQVFVHRDRTSMVDGYVVLDDGVGDQTLDLLELTAADPAVERLLWQHVVGDRSPRRVVARRRPIDDVARWALADPRAYRVDGRSDATWLRIVDLDVALGARTYGATIANVVVQIEDPWYHSNCGTWRIDAYGAFRSQARPDLRAGISEVSSAYLGAVSWVELRDAGRIEERRPGAAYDADALFAHRPYPYTPPTSYR